MLKRAFISGVIFGILSLALSAFTAVAHPQSESDGYIIEHIIERGEFLNHIVKKYNTSTAKILELNPGLEPDKIRAGQKIRIQPNSNSTVAKPATERGVSEKSVARERGEATPEKESPKTAEKPKEKSAKSEEKPIAKPQSPKSEELVPTTEFIEHTVASGERFSHIVVNYHTTTVKILKHNPDLVPARIRTGDKIRIPITVYKRAESASDNTPSEGTYHTVVSGDTMNKIARTYETTVAKIRELNNIENDDHIRIGQKLRIK